MSDVDSSNNRAAYMEWLKDEVEKHCNKDGRFEVYWDSRDSISPDQIFEAFKLFEEKGFTSPLAYLEDMMLDGADGESDFYENYLIPDLTGESDEVLDGWDEAQSVWDDLEEVGYQGIDLNLGQLLEQSEFRVNIFFATEAEKNLDFGGIVSAFGNDYRDPNLEYVDAEDLDNALSYLVNQQGHSVTELYDYLIGKESESPLIRSIREEISENSSEAMSNLAALLRMDGNELLRFLEARDKGVDSLVLPKGNATLGIFNQWSGCGGVLDIQLERDAILPLSMAWDFSVEGCHETNRWGCYTVDETYGLVGSMWQPNFSYQKGTLEGVKEDYARVLEQARTAADERDDTGLTLSDEAEKSRASSSALEDRKMETSSARDEQTI